MGLGPSLVGELLAPCRNKLSKCTCCVVWCVLCCVVCSGVVCGQCCCCGVVVVCGYPYECHNTPAVCQRLFGFLTTLTFTALRKNRIVSAAFDTIAKNKKMKPRSPRVGQQCIMKCQEHNRSKKGTLRGKKRSLVHGCSTKNDSCNRRQITLQGIYVHFGLN